MADTQFPTQLAPPSRGFKGRRGRGRGSRGRGRGAPAPLEPPSDQVDRVRTAPQRSSVIREVKNDPTKVENIQPKSKSTTPSAERNDPLIHDMLLIDGVSGMIQVQTQRDFQLDFSQFEEIIRASYESHTTHDRGLKKFISFSQFKYYYTILLWKRLWQVLSSRGIMSLEYIQLTNSLNFDLPIPTDLSMYLDGIGDFVDASGRTFQLSLQAQLNDLAVSGVAGTFGQIADANHLQYETIPSPFVAFWNMVADMNRTILDAADGPIQWDLPTAVRPAEALAALLPTRNLIGYSTSMKLTYDQRQAMETAGIQTWTAAEQNAQSAVNIANLPINRHIMMHVAGELQSSKCQAIVSAWNESSKGSVAKSLFSDRVQNDVAVDGRNIAGKAMTTNSYAQHNVHIVCGAANFRYRIRRDPQFTDTLCYSFEAPRDAWLNNSGAVFNFGAAQALWNITHFKISEQDGVGLANQLSNRIRKRFIRD